MFNRSFSFSRSFFCWNEIYENLDFSIFQKILEHVSKIWKNIFL